MLNVALHQQSRISKLKCRVRDLGVPTQIGHGFSIENQVSETPILSPLRRSHDSEIQKRSRIQPDRMLTVSTENHASSHCAMPDFGGIGKSLPNWTEQATETLRAYLLRGDLQKRGDSFTPLALLPVIARVPVTAKILGARGKEASKGLLPTLTPQPTSSDYRSVKIEICMIAMMNMGMAVAQ
jgi:hypothetical protein